MYKEFLSKFGILEVFFRISWLYFLDKAQWRFIQYKSESTGLVCVRNVWNCQLRSPNKKRHEPQVSITCFNCSRFRAIASFFLINPFTDIFLAIIIV